jgi:hypothetical protein
MLAPFLAGWAVFMYYWVFLLWDLWDALSAPSIITSLGYMIYFRWSNQIRTEAAGLEAFTMMLDWDEYLSIPENNVKSRSVSLYEPEAEVGTLANFCPFCGTDLSSGLKGERPAHCGSCGERVPVKPGNNEENGDPMWGVYFTKDYFKRPMVDPFDGTEFSEIVWMHDAPRDKTFRKVGGQWFTHKGQTFEIAAANPRATYVGFKEEMSHIKFFKVTSDPERTRQMQINIGLTPAETSLDELNRAMKIETVRSAIPWMLKYREADAHARVLEETQDDAKTRSYKATNRLVDDLDRVRSSKRFQKIKKLNMKQVIAIVAVVVLIYFGLSYLEVI